MPRMSAPRAETGNEPSGGPGDPGHVATAGLSLSPFRGLRYDCGSKAGFLQATVAFGLSRPDLRDEFSAYLHDMIVQQKAAQ